MSAPTGDPQVIRAQEWHTCAFCVALQRFAIRRREPVLLDAAIRLRDVHAANDQEQRVSLRRRPARRPE